MADIVLDNVTKRYPDGLLAVDGIEEIHDLVVPVSSQVLAF